MHVDATAVETHVQLRRAISGRASSPCKYRGASLVRRRLLLGPFSRRMSRDLW